MNSNLNTAKLSDASTKRSDQPNPPRIIRTHFPPDHLISQDEIQKCHNKIQYDRSLTDVQKHRLQGHSQHVEQFGLIMDFEVPENEVAAWDWVKPYLRKEEWNG